MIYELRVKTGSKGGRSAKPVLTLSAEWGVFFVRTKPKSHESFIYHSFRLTRCPFFTVKLTTLTAVYSAQFGPTTGEITRFKGLRDTRPDQ